MLSIEKRKVSPKEGEAIKARQAKWGEKAAHFILLFIGSTACWLLPFLWYDKK